MRYQQKSTNNTAPARVSSLSDAKRYLGWLLARQEYAEVDLRQKAKLKGYEPEHIDAALAFMQQHGLQDDKRYAGMKARQVAPRKGDRFIEQALRSKKMSSEVIQAQLEELPVESERAWAWLERFAIAGWGPEVKQWAWRRLASRGFGTDAIKNAIAKLEHARRGE